MLSLASPIVLATRMPRKNSLYGEGLPLVSALNAASVSDDFAKASNFACSASNCDSVPKSIGSPVGELKIHLLRANDLVEPRRCRRQVKLLRPSASAPTNC